MLEKKQMYSFAIDSDKEQPFWEALIFWYII